MKEVIGDTNPRVPLSPAVRGGDYVYISGQVPKDPTTGAVKGSSIEEQTAIVLRKIDDLVRRSGGTLKDIVKTTVFLTDISLFSRMNAEYAKFFAQEPPARSCIHAGLAIDALIEIEAIAHIPKG